MAEASRYNYGKPPLNYVLTFGAALRSFAEVCRYGETKYERYNYLKGGKPLSEYTDCILRHLVAWQRGEDLDPESGVSHLGHVVWNALALAHFALTGNCTDDRPPRVPALRIISGGRSEEQDHAHTNRCARIGCESSGWLKPAEEA
jgi:hypothetical protein